MLYIDYSYLLHFTFICLALSVQLTSVFTHDSTEPSSGQLLMADRLKWSLEGIVMADLQRGLTWHWTPGVRGHAWKQTGASVSAVLWHGLINVWWIWDRNRKHSSFLVPVHVHSFERGLCDVCPIRCRIIIVHCALTNELGLFGQILEVKCQKFVFQCFVMFIIHYSAVRKDQRSAQRELECVLRSYRFTVFSLLLQRATFRIKGFTLCEDSFLIKILHS